MKGTKANSVFVPFFQVPLPRAGAHRPVRQDPARALQSSRHAFLQSEVSHPLPAQEGAGGETEHRGRVDTPLDDAAEQSGALPSQRQLGNGGSVGGVGGNSLSSNVCVVRMDGSVGSSGGDGVVGCDVVVGPVVDHDRRVRRNVDTELGRRRFRVRELGPGRPRLRRSGNDGRRKELKLKSRRMM